MADLYLETWRDIQQFNEHAVEWDDLWERTPIQQPATRSKPLAAWLRSFAAKRRLRILTVRRGSRLLAALPLVSGRYRHVVPVTALARNSWSYAGELLLDIGHDSQQVCKLLVDQFRRLRTPLLRFEDVPYTSPQWQTFFAAMDRSELDYRRNDTFSIGTIEIAKDWDTYKAMCSKNHRKKMSRLSRRLEKVGKVEFHLYTNLRPDQVGPLLRCGFELEHQSWKGAEGTSALSSPGKFEFYLQQAKALAADACLCLSFLSCGGQPIAFEYGWIAKQTYFSPKIAYDPTFAKYSPGHLLLWRLLERFHKDAKVSSVDFFGPTTLATSHWTTGSYPVGHITLAPSGLVGLTGKIALTVVGNVEPEAAFGFGNQGQPNCPVLT